MTVLNYKLLRGHYKEEWGEHGDWVTERVKSRDKRDAKREIQQQLEEMEIMDSVFIIINEWMPSGSEFPLTEVIDGEYSLTKSEAWDKLHNIAGVHDVELNQNEYRFDLPIPPADFEYECFYIEELWRG